MKTWQRYGLVALIAFVVGALAFQPSKQKPEVKIETVTKIDTVTVVKRDSVPFIPVIKDKTVTKEDVTITVPTEQEPDGTQVKTKLYKGTKVFDDVKAKLEYEIFADSLHATSFNLEVEEQTVIKEVVTTIEKTLPPKSALFIGGGVDFGEGIQAAEIGLMYNRRQKWQAGIVVNQDLTGNLPQNMRTTVGGRVYIKL